MRNLLCWLWPRTPQELWNILLVIFIGVLAVVAWEQYASDAAYLTIGESAFDTGSGVATIGIENDGRRPSSSNRVQKPRPGGEKGERLGR